MSLYSTVLRTIPGIVFPRMLTMLLVNKPNISTMALIETLALKFVFNWLHGLSGLGSLVPQWNVKNLTSPLEKHNWSFRSVYSFAMASIRKH